MLFGLFAIQRLFIFCVASLFFQDQNWAKTHSITQHLNLLVFPTVQYQICSTLPKFDVFNRSIFHTQYFTASCIFIFSTRVGCSQCQKCTNTYGCTKSSISIFFRKLNIIAFLRKPRQSHLLNIEIRFQVEVCTAPISFSQMSLLRDWVWHSICQKCY